MTDDIHSPDIHENATAYVLGGLGPEETHEFETHVPTCPDCLKEVAQMRDLTAQLSETVATDPPAELRSSILSEIAATAQDGSVSNVPAQLSRAGGRHAAAVAGSEEGAEQSNVLPLRRSWPTRAGSLVAAAAVVAAVGFGGWALNERNDARDQADQLAQVLAATDVEAVSSPTADGGSATVVRSKSQGVALLVASDLPDLADDMVYEAWTFEGETPVPAGTFESSGDHTTFELTSAALETGTVAVTVEPDGGSDTPTSEAIFAVDLSS